MNSFFKPTGFNVNKIWIYMLKVQQTTTITMAFTHTMCNVYKVYSHTYLFFNKKKIFVLRISYLIQLTCLTINHLINNITDLGIHIWECILRNILERVHMATTIYDFSKSRISWCNNSWGSYVVLYTWFEKPVFFFNS